MKKENELLLKFLKSRIRPEQPRKFEVLEGGQVAVPVLAAAPVSSPDAPSDRKYEESQKEADRKSPESVQDGARENLEKLLEESRMLNEALKYIISLVVHEVRVPLNSLRTQARFIQEKAAASGQDALNHAASVLVRNVEQINYVLAHLDPAFDPSMLMKEQFELAVLLEEIYDTLSPLALERKVGFRRPQCGPVVLEADRAKLREVLFNIVENGIKYNVPGGELNVSAFEDAGKVRIVVEDTGMGMDENVLNSIKALKPVELSSTMKNANARLGMSIVKRIIAEHGGSLEVSSSSGKGTRVEIILNRDERKEIRPVKESEIVSTVSPRQETVQKEKTGPVTKKIKILVIDDDTLTSTKIQECFSPEECEVISVNTGPLGVAVASEMNPDIITLDILMMGMSGFDVLDRLKKNERTRNIPVIMLSNIRAESKARKAGASAFIQKPVKKEVLVKTVMELAGAKNNR